MPAIAVVPRAAGRRSCRGGGSFGRVLGVVRRGKAGTHWITELRKQLQTLAVLHWEMGTRWALESGHLAGAI
jgi:hypothetical protein